MSKICDFKEAIISHCDCDWRSRNDFAFESARKDKASIQEKEGNQPPAEIHLKRHMRGRIGKLDSIVVRSTVGINRRQCRAAQVPRSALETPKHFYQRAI
jgi:hypothetical protein